MKTATTVAISVATAPFASGQIGSTALASSEPPQDILEGALTIAQADSMYVQAINELSAWKLAFDITPRNALFSVTLDSLVGLTYKQVKTESARFGGDLTLTIDIRTKLLLAVQFVIGWCWDDRLHVESTIFDARFPAYPQIVSPRSLNGATSPMVIPRTMMAWELLRLDQTNQVFKDEVVIDSGWPPESPGRCYWHYQGCSQASWIKDKDSLVYRCTQVIEASSCESSDQHTLDLSYVPVDTEAKPS